MIETFPQSEHLSQEEEEIVALKLNAVPDSSTISKGFVGLDFLAREESKGTAKVHPLP